MENEKKKNNEEELESVSTQEMIADSKARRETRKKEFKCEQCEYKSGSITMLNRHKKSLHQESTYKCKQCDYTSDKTATLEKHVSTVHKTNCDKGEKGSEEEGNHTQHTETIQGTLHQCEQCDYKSQTTANINRHMSSAHRKGYVPRRKKCEHCDKKFNKNETLMKHMREDHNMETHVTQEYTSKSIEKNSIEMAFQRQLRSNKTG